MLVAIDTSTAVASVALHDGSRVRIEHTWESPRRHTVELTPRLVSAIEQLDLRPERLAGIAVTCGPGSFTGLRVGLAVAKGLALARGLPLIGVPTLDVVAFAHGQDERPLVAVLEAGRGRICAATYHWQDGEWQAVIAPRLTTWRLIAAEIIRPTLFSGEIDHEGLKELAACKELVTMPPAAARLRRAGFLAEIGWQRLNRGQTDDPAALVPLYLQHPT
ncbi:MAG: tRNA (adenosine(37)-N6)-threonylcarbamoyltransferase complex dimerization subunit type 1 TsaB [Anaerolineales bacterium]|nr:tRNA (adenosine(37)-N6)-threonylcarbamoyltransferase complex dimerization subunit type 1 TsaB [Anaerolineales bacterium]